MKNFIIRSYVTENTPYVEVGERYLAHSLSRFGDINYIIDTVPNLGTWLKNTAYKPEFILKYLSNSTFKSTIFLDADATVEQYPILFDMIPDEYDIACHYLDWEKWYGHTSGRKELLSGTLLFRNNRENVIKLVTQWRDEAKKADEWEQKTLARLLENNKDIKIYELPLEYIYIKTLPDGREPRVKVEHPVIVHHQLSRQFKRTLR